MPWQSQHGSQTSLGTRRYAHQHSANFCRRRFQANNKQAPRHQLLRILFHVTRFIESRNNARDRVENNLIQYMHMCYFFRMHSAIGALPAGPNTEKGSRHPCAVPLVPLGPSRCPFGILWRPFAAFLTDFGSFGLALGLESFNSSLYWPRLGL